MTAFKTFTGAWATKENVIAAFVAIAGSFLLARVLDERGLIELGEEWIATLTALGFAVPVWAAWSIISAPFLAWHQDRKVGTVFGNRFVYNEPILVGMFRCKPTGKEERYSFRIKDAEPESFVYCDIRIDGPGHLAHVGLGSNMFTGLLPHLEGRRWGFRLLLDRSAQLRIMLPTNAISPTVRIYCHNFTIGNPDDQDGTPGNA